MKKIGIGKSHSKIILMGEHSVVYGYPAIALPLKNIEVTCSIRPAQEKLKLDIKDPLSTAIFAALEYLEIKDHPITYAIASTVPQKRGMGSSAAVSIAAVRAVFDYFEAELDQAFLQLPGSINLRHDGGRLSISLHGRGIHRPAPTEKPALLHRTAGRMGAMVRLADSSRPTARIKRKPFARAVR